VGIAGGQHSGGCGGGFGERGGSIKYGDSDAAAVEFESQREADDAGPGDADVTIRKARVMHGISLVGWRRGYSLGVPVCRLTSGRRSPASRERRTEM
jgi:hypothetical protein